MVMLRPSCFGAASTVAQLGHVLGEPLQQPEPQLGAGLLATAEHDRDLDLVATLEEAHDVALLGLVVVGVDLRSELLLLDHGELLVAAGLPGLLRALVLELAVVHELADRRAGGGGDLDEVELGLLRQPQGVLDAHDADLLAVRADQADLGNADAVVDARLCADGVSSFRRRWCDGAETRRSSGPATATIAMAQLRTEPGRSWSGGWEPGLHLIALTLSKTRDRVVAFRRLPAPTGRAETGRAACSARQRQRGGPSATFS